MALIFLPARPITKTYSMAIDVIGPANGDMVLSGTRHNKKRGRGRHDL